MSPLEHLASSSRRLRRPADEARVRAPALELRIYRDHGRHGQTNAGHVSLEQLEVMSAIENAARQPSEASRALRGCAYTTIAYNSCRKPALPKCPSGRAKEWLADRGLIMLRCVLHVVFTSRRESPTSLTEQGRGLRSLSSLAEDHARSSRTQPRGARIGITSVAQLGRLGPITTTCNMMCRAVAISPTASVGVCRRSPPVFFSPFFFFFFFFFFPLFFFSFFFFFLGFFFFLCFFFPLSRRKSWEKLVAAHEVGRSFFGDHVHLADDTPSQPPGPLASQGVLTQSAGRGPETVGTICRVIPSSLPLPTAVDRLERQGVTLNGRTTHRGPR